LYHISSFIRHLKLPFGDHSLRATLSCAGSAVADSPIMTVKCNHLPPVFDEHEGQCRCTCARACILIRNWNLPSHGGRNTSTVTAWSADPFKSHQKILSAFIKLTKGTWLFLPCPCIASHSAPPCPILELGCGPGSTSLLHAQALLGRLVVSADSNMSWCDPHKHAHPLHEFKLVEQEWAGWDALYSSEAVDRKDWSIVFIDHWPSVLRPAALRRFRSTST
jgi:hypothetical protein